MISDSRVEQIMLAPKTIGEVIKWKPRTDGRPSGVWCEVRIISPGLDCDLKLRGEFFRNRRNEPVWSWTVLSSEIRQPLLRIDKHDGHINPDETEISGCMIHRWCMAHKDREAHVAPRGIDCTDVDTALPGFLAFAGIDLRAAYQSRDWRMQ